MVITRAVLSKVIFPTPETVDFDAKIPTDSIFFKFIVPVLFTSTTQLGRASCRERV